VHELRWDFQFRSSFRCALNSSACGAICQMHLHHAHFPKFIWSCIILGLVVWFYILKCYCYCCFLLILPQCLTAVCSTFSSTESYPIWVGFAVSCRGMNSSNSCRKLFRIQPPLYVCAENLRQTVMLQQRWSGCQHYVTWGLWCVCCPLALYSSFLSIYSVSKKTEPC